MAPSSPQAWRPSFLAPGSPSSFPSGFGPTPSLLVAGLLVHGTGMTLKYRLENRSGPPPWWERALFWLCWACLAALGLWLVVAFATAR